MVRKIEIPSQWKLDVIEFVKYTYVIRKITQISIFPHPSSNVMSSNSIDDGENQIINTKAKAETETEIKQLKLEAIQ